MHIFIINVPFIAVISKFVTFQIILLNILRFFGEVYGEFILRDHK